MSRVVVVSNRVALPKERREAATGGLTVGVFAALESHGGAWFGWSGKTVAREPRDPKIVRAGSIAYATIDINERDFDGYYNGFSNDTLWPLFHYLLGFFSFSRAQYEAYCRVNELFARKLLPLLEPDDIIWVHDYHLIPLASELRKAGIKQPIGFFLHVPFPDFELLRALPPYEHLLRCLAAYDVVGFQTDHDLRSFQEAIAMPAVSGELLGENRVRAYGRSFIADVFSIGVDVDVCQRLARDYSDEPEVNRMRRSLLNRHLIVGVDRLDYSKGLMLRFSGYERLLAKYPTNRRQVSFMQIAPPTRTGVRAYAAIREELEQAAGHINGRFAEMDWVPIRYLNRAYRRGVLMPMLRMARIGLVTPIRDGMNLVAKEYVASQDEESPGVLVLSTLAGAARELDAAVLVNPYDTEAMADGLQRALNMRLEERQERHRAMLEVLRRNDIHTWCRRFLDALHSTELRMT